MFFFSFGARYSIGDVAICNFIKVLLSIYSNGEKLKSFVFHLQIFIVFGMY